MTMERKKIHLEYLLNATSKSILWSAISTPTGLEGWFADRVQSDDKIVDFFWGKTEKRTAEIVAVRAYSFIRFRWFSFPAAHVTAPETDKLLPSRSKRQMMSRRAALCRSGSKTAASP